MIAGAARVAVRLGARTIRRNRWRSAIVALLIALPVAAMAGAAVVLETVTPSPEDRAVSVMGAADLLVTPLGDDAGMDRLRSELPSGARVELLAVSGDVTVVDGTEYGVELRMLDLDGLGAGMLTVVEGRPPTSPDEVAIGPTLARLAGTGVGGSLELDELGPRRVVGLVEDPENFKAPVVLAPPTSVIPADPVPSFLIRLPAGAQVDELLASPLFDELGEPSFVATTRAQASRPSPSQALGLFVLGGLALIEAALVASAAFAVSLRRRQRELGLLGAVGGEPRHLAASVLAEGALLGIAGAVAGVAIAFLGAAALAPWLDDLTGRRNPPLAISLHWPLLAAGIGLGAALLAALLPARMAARTSVLAALSGRRPPTAPARRMLWLGLAMIAIAFGVTLGGAAYRSRDSDGLVSAFMLLAGAVLGVLGFGACSPWLLERFEGVAGRLPLAPRLALRDTARFRGRNGPIVTAVLAAFAATVALSALFSSQAARAASFYTPFLREDQLLVAGAGADTAGRRAATELGALAAVPLAEARGLEGEEVFIEVSHPDSHGFGAVGIGDTELLTALGAEEAVEAFRRGVVILLVQDDLEVDSAILHTYTEEAGSTGPGQVIEVRAVRTHVPFGMVPNVVMSVDTGRSLGLRGEPDGRFLLRLPRKVSPADVAAAGRAAAEHPATAVTVERGPQRPDEPFRLLLLVGSLILALSVTGVAVALGEAETRRDLRTLLALGADPRVRRRITAARAGVLATIAGVLAVPAGLLPVWGVLMTRGMPLVVPLPEVVAALAVLPLTAVVGAAVLSRPIAPWTEYRS